MAAKLSCLYLAMRDKLTACMLFFLLVSSVGYGQTVTGKVSEENGDPIAGVTVMIKNTRTGVSTNASGQYTIQAGADAVLVFSTLGYTPVEEATRGRTTVNVVLKSRAESMTEVVVTALGIKKDTRKLGYATETVKLDEIQQNRTTNIMTSLEGKVAGLDISPPSAGAGSSTKIRLRGQAAFSGGGNSPLIVINGLPMDQGARSADGNNSIDLGDNMQQINPDDVEKMTILKGASAAALYGSRAANGAIIITTKSGSKNQKFGVEYSSNFSSDEVLDYSNFQTVYGQGTGGVRPTTQGTAISTGQLGWGEKLDGVPTVQFDGELRPYSAQPNRITSFFRTGTSAVNTIALSGGNDRGSYRASYSNQDAKGIMPNNAYHKKIFNFGVNNNITSKLSLQVNLNYTNENNVNPPQVGVQGQGAPNFLYRMANNISLDVLRDKAVNALGIETQTSGFQSTLINPYFLMGRQFYYNKRDRYLGTATVRYDIWKGVYAQGRVNMDYNVNFTEQNSPTGVGTSTANNSTNTGFNGTYGVNTGNGRQMNMDFMLGGSHTFGDFSVDVSVGGNTFMNRSRNFNQNVTDFTVRDLYSIENGITRTQSFGIGRSTVNSLYAFGDFGYKSFLYLNATVRRDWFSVLDPQNNNYTYPSVSASFVFSEFLKNVSWLNYGKIRATFADVGSINGIGEFQGNLVYGILQNTFNGLSLGNISNGSSPNKLLKPFSIRENEIGLEVKTFNSRLNLDVSAYQKTTTDQIISIPLSNASGYGSTPLNLGSLRNRGVDLVIDGTPVKLRNFTWNSSFNTGYNTSKVLQLAPGTTRQVVASFGGNEFLGSLVYEVGKPLNQLAGRTYQRDAEGRILVGSNGRLLQSSSDVLFGSANPKFTGGWSNNFRYKSLSLLVHIDYKIGGKIISSTALNGLRQGFTQASLVGRSGVVFDGVTTGGVQNTVSVDPQTFYADYRNQQIVDPFLYKGDFVKLRNITLSYDLSRWAASQVKFVKGLTLSASCRNVAILKKYLDDLDPEAFASSGDNRVGYEQTTLPTTRTYGLNLNVKF